MKKTLTKADILPLNEYEQKRDTFRSRVMLEKTKRRAFVGPFAVFYFENYDTLWWQVHEMLRIEKGGEEQIDDELKAYAPLLPQGHEFVVTFMLEIDHPETRDHILSQLGGIDQMIKIKFADEEVFSTPALDQERTTAEGRISSVHFLHFKLTSQQVKKFKAADHPAIIDIFHPNYTYELELPPEVHESLKVDLE